MFIPEPLIVRHPVPYGPELRWDERLQGEHDTWWRLFRDLLDLRRRRVVPLLSTRPERAAEVVLLGERAFRITWHLAGWAAYSLLANLADQALEITCPSAGERIHATPGAAGSDGTLGPWSTLFVLQGGDGGTGTPP